MRHRCPVDDIGYLHKRIDPVFKVQRKIIPGGLCGGRQIRSRRFPLGGFRLYGIPELLQVQQMILRFRTGIDGNIVHNHFHPAPVAVVQAHGQRKAFGKIHHVGGEGTVLVIDTLAGLFLAASRLEGQEQEAVKAGGQRHFQIAAGYLQRIAFRIVRNRILSQIGAVGEPLLGENDTEGMGADLGVVV